MIIEDMRVHENRDDRQKGRLALTKCGQISPHSRPIHTKNVFSCTCRKKAYVAISMTLCEQITHICLNTM